MTNVWAIGNGRLLTKDRVISDGLVIVDGSKIVYAGPRDDAPPAARAARTMDARGGYISPGFIDVHVHGGGGADVMDGTEAALQTMARSHARHGTTGLLATTMTAPHERLLDVVRTVRQAVAKDEPPQGARVLGLHLEGPYVNAQRAGAQNPDHMRPPCPKELEQLWDAAGDSWRLVTLAPELPGALDAIRFLKDRGVAVSMGHTAADEAAARKAIRVGATMATHTFNAMNTLHHREPGLLGAVLDDESVWAELIADTLHVHPLMMRLLYKLKGAEKTVLITDSMRAQGCGDGDYMLGDLPVVVNDGEARLRADDSDVPGPLAGSVLTMDAAVRAMVRYVGAPVVEAIRMATYNSARAIDLQGRKGVLAKGHDADIVVLDDGLHVQMTVVEGRIVYTKSA